MAALNERTLAVLLPPPPLRQTHTIRDLNVQFMQSIPRPSPWLQKGRLPPSADPPQTALLMGAHAPPSTSSCSNFLKEAAGFHSDGSDPIIIVGSVVMETSDGAVVGNRPLHVPKHKS